MKNTSDVFYSSLGIDKNSVASMNRFRSFVKEFYVSKEMMSKFLRVNSSFVVSFRLRRPRFMKNTGNVFYSSLGIDKNSVAHRVMEDDRSIALVHNLEIKSTKV
jgi:hypothetical protein